MIVVTKLNDQKIAVNASQIECIELIPEAKIIMMNGKFHVVKETLDEILEKTIEYYGEIKSFVHDK